MIQAVIIPWASWVVRFSASHIGFWTRSIPIRKGSALRVVTPGRLMATYQRLLWTCCSLLRGRITLNTSNSPWSSRFTLYILYICLFFLFYLNIFDLCNKRPAIYFLLPRYTHFLSPPKYSLRFRGKSYIEILLQRHNFLKFLSSSWKAGKEEIK